MESSAEDLGDSGMFRYIGDTATQPSLGSTDNDLLLRQPFIDSKHQSEQLLGEVSPREQDEDKGIGQESPGMVVTPIPEIASTPEDTSESSREESQSDSAESLLVPNGYSSKESSHDKLRSVSKDWVRNEIQSNNEIHKQEMDKLSQQWTVRFEEERKIKQKQVRDLTEALEHEISTRTEVEGKLKMSTDKVGELEVVVKTLQEELKMDKQNNSTALQSLVKSQNDLQQNVHELRRDIPASQSDPGPLSPTECKFSFLSGEAHPPDPQHDRTVHFIPSPTTTWPPSQLEHQDSVD